MASAFIDILTKHKIAISMDSKGRAYDNIKMERFWRNLKYENVYLCRYENLKEAKECIRNYIEKYNSHRLHSSLGYKIPMSIYREYIENVA